MARFSHFSPVCILAGIIKQARLVSKAKTASELSHNRGRLLFAAYACILLRYARLSGTVNGRMCNRLPLRSTVSQCTFMSREAALCVRFVCSLCFAHDSTFVSYGEHASNSCDLSQLILI